MIDSKNPNQMIVEGYDDLFSVIGLMRAHVDWPYGKAAAPVYINFGNGAEEILKDDVLGTYLKSPVIKTFGIILDADTKPRGRYESIRNLCIEFFPNFPSELPQEGLVIENVDKKRLGVWIMPDNISDGALETFLKYLVPSGSESAWKHAERSVEMARKIGCSCRDTHVEKANLYTWLAWQDTPGQSPGTSLTQKVLDPRSPCAAAFVDWFQKLYQLPIRTKLFT